MDTIESDGRQIENRYRSRSAAAQLPCVDQGTNVLRHCGRQCMVSKINGRPDEFLV